MHDLFKKADAHPTAFDFRDAAVGEARNSEKNANYQNL